jgi:UDP-N-acetylmuramoylalanine--D-glutamate ligase
LIIGGSDKNLKFNELAKVLHEIHVDLVVLPGTAYNVLTASLKRKKVLFADVATLEEALRLLTLRSHKGDVIALSPGCASFGMFSNEFERGALFKKIVSHL